MKKIALKNAARGTAFDYGQPSYIMELTPAFTDVIVKRYIRITGKTTVRCVRQGRELPREEIAAIFEPDEEGGEQE